VQAVQAYCRSRGLRLQRTPRLGFEVWKRRIEEAIRQRSVFTLLCHPIYLTVRAEGWGSPLEEFLFPVIELLGELARRKQVWVCTCGQMAQFYSRATA